MIRKMFSISLGLSLIVLVFGAGFTSDTIGNINEIETRSIIETPLGDPLSNDYLIGYWKCDECGWTTKPHKASACEYAIKGQGCFGNLCHVWLNSNCHAVDMPINTPPEEG